MDSEKPQKYDAWNDQKKKLANENRRLFFKEGEIWWCSLGMNLGNESFGKGGTFRRPVLVIKKLSGESCIVTPLTSKEKTGSWFIDISLHGEKKWVMLHQVRIIDTKRFQRRMAFLDEYDFARVKEKLKTLLELS